MRSRPGGTGARDGGRRGRTHRAPPHAGRAAALAARLGVPVAPAHASAAPGVAEAVRALAARGRTRVAVASYFTAPGRFHTETAGAAPWIASAPLGAHPDVARLVLHRYDAAAEAGRTAPAAHHALVPV